MKQKLIILLILSIALVGNACAGIPSHPTYINYDTSQSGHVIWSWSHADDGDIIDSYNVSLDSIWYNGSLQNRYDDNVGVGKTSHIEIWSYNNSGTGNLSAPEWTLYGSQKGVIQFNGVTDTIESTVPVFGALSGLIVAVVPYLLTLIVVTGIITLIGFLFKRERVFR